MNRIILLDTEFTKRLAKKQELEYYQDNLKELQRKQRLIDQEIRLTHDIIDLVKSEITGDRNE